MTKQTWILNWLLLLLIGITGSIANNIIMRLPFNFPIGLYMDTVFTVSAAFLGGLIPGLICAVLTTIIQGIVYYFTTGEPYFWAWYFYMLCSIIAVFLVCLFARFFPEECKSLRITEKTSNQPKTRQGPLLILLATLSLAMCIVISIAGGIISTVITLFSDVIPHDTPPETWFRLGFIRQGFGLLASEIFARIPVNLVDKSIAVLAGWGIAYLVKRTVFHTK